MPIKIDFLKWEECEQSAKQQLLQLFHQHPKQNVFYEATLYTLTQKKTSFWGTSEQTIEFEFQQTLLLSSKLSTQGMPYFYVVGPQKVGKGAFGLVRSVPLCIAYGEEGFSITPQDLVVKLQRLNVNVDEKKYRSEAQSLRRRYPVYLDLLDRRKGIDYVDHYIVMDNMGAPLSNIKFDKFTFEERCSVSLAIVVELQRIHRGGAVFRERRSVSVSDTSEMSRASESIDILEEMGGRPHALSKWQSTAFSDISEKDQASESPGLLEEMECVSELPGYVHRDLKPENILLKKKRVKVKFDNIAAALSDKDGSLSKKVKVTTGEIERTIISIIDDNLAREVDESGEVRGQSGTFGYMPPEAFVGRGRITRAADVYALAGVFAYVWGAENPLRHKIGYETHHGAALQPYSLRGWLTCPSKDLSQYVRDTLLLRSVYVLIRAMSYEDPANRPSVEEIQKFFTFVRIWRKQYQYFAKAYARSIPLLRKLILPYVSEDFIMLLDNVALGVITSLKSIKKYLEDHALEEVGNTDEVVRLLISRASQFFTNYHVDPFHIVAGLRVPEYEEKISSKEKKRCSRESDLFNINELKKFYVWLQYFKRFYDRCYVQLAEHCNDFLVDTDFLSDAAEILRDLLDEPGLSFLEEMSDDQDELSDQGDAGEDKLERFIYFAVRRCESYQKFVLLVQELIESLKIIFDGFRFDEREELLGILHANFPAVSRIKRLHAFMQTHQLVVHGYGADVFTKAVILLTQALATYSEDSLLDQYRKKTADPFKRKTMQTLIEALAPFTEWCVVAQEEVKTYKSKLFDSELAEQKNRGLENMRQVAGRESPPLSIYTQIIDIAAKRKGMFFGPVFGRSKSVVELYVALAAKKEQQHSL